MYIRYHLVSPLFFCLCPPENPDVSQSGFGGHRVITDRWKGMSPRQVGEIRATQEMQREEKEVCVYLCHPSVCLSVCLSVYLS